MDMPFNDNGEPKPVILVGENGSGKTIFQAQIMDSFYEITSNIFDNIASHIGPKRHYYKTSGESVLQIRETTSFVILKFISNNGESIEYYDKLNKVEKKDFIQLIPDFNLEPNINVRHQKKITPISKSKKEQFRAEWRSGAYFYQPAYRYEEPFWKHESFVGESRSKDQTRHLELGYISHLDKELEIMSSTKNNKFFLLNLLLSKFVYDQDFTHGALWINTNKVLKEILKNNKYRLGIGPMSGGRISVTEDLENGVSNQVLPSIDNLSLGQSTLLNLFVNIIRHSGDYWQSVPLDQIQGIVVIDEIDVHLHTDLQHSVLPKLIQMFPKVQFILTTHSPMFLLGMKKVFGEEGFEIRNLPTGEVITTERFSEFEKAYDVLRETKRFEEEIKQKIESSTKPILFVEGDYDVKYINVAAEKLGKLEILEKIQIYDAGGYGSLDRVWKSYDSKLAEVIPQKILLMYDCDTKKEDAERSKVFKRVIPKIDDNSVEKGIENLFKKSTLNKALKNKKVYIDITCEVNKVERGEKVVIPEKWEINPNEKGNLCSWICKNGTKNDFKNFEQVFKIIEDVLLADEGK